MTRLPEIKREALEPEQLWVWDKVEASRGSVDGPYDALMRIPALAGKICDLGDYFRNESLLSGADRELAILATAREIGSQYEWDKHEKLARQAGARSEAIEAVRSMRFDSLSQRELVIVEVVQSLFRTKSLPQRLYQKAIDELSETILIELVTLAGFRCSIAFLISAFEINARPGKDPF